MKSKEGRFASTYEAESLPVVIAEARRLSARSGDLECGVYVDKLENQDLNYISVVLRRLENGETVSVFKAERSRAPDIIEAETLRLADPGTSAEELRRFILPN